MISGDSVRDTLSVVAPNVAATIVTGLAPAVRTVTVSPVSLRPSEPVDDTNQLLTPAHAGEPPPHTTTALPGSRVSDPLAAAANTCRGPCVPAIDALSSIVTPVRSRTLFDLLTSSMNSSALLFVDVSQFVSDRLSASIASLITRSPAAGGTAVLLLSIMQTEGDASLQVQPDSTSHLALQPSPPMLSPSSQNSSRSSSPSPHVVVDAKIWIS